jgi:hypothetical protein
MNPGGTRVPRVGFGVPPKPRGGRSRKCVGVTLELPGSRQPEGQGLFDKLV